MKRGAKNKDPGQRLRILRGDPCVLARSAGFEREELRHESTFQQSEPQRHPVRPSCPPLTIVPGHPTRSAFVRRRGAYSHLEAQEGGAVAGNRHAKQNLLLRPLLLRIDLDIQDMVGSGIREISNRLRYEVPSGKCLML